ncbi:MAG: hypothetical protein DME23_05970 [Verrucomicrobia bacterium]|nr:MAG: hypothetical protein DME23_05970 [Verrucomicrobiota bacterium]
MANVVSMPRSLLIYGLCIPVAILLGYLIATPFNTLSLVFVGLSLFVLSIPIFLRWHHALAIFTWNSYLVLFFLPGQPNLGIAAAAISLFISLVDRLMHRHEGFLRVPSVARSLLFLTLVVLVTAKLTGGIGGQVFGAESWGAKRYLGVLGAIVGYFALVSRPVPEDKARLYASIFVLSGVTAVVSDLAYAAGPRFYFLFTLFPATLAFSQALSEGDLLRLSGVCFAAVSVYQYLLMRYGIRGLCDWSRPWRLAAFAALFAASAFGGYRSSILLGLLILFVQFYLEALHKTKLLPIFLLAGALLAALLLGFSERLPLSFQRSLSFLPIKVDAAAKYDAQYTLDWRLEIWRIVTPEVPKYLLLGKGFAYSGTDYYLTQEAIKRGLYQSEEDALVSGNYHQGILTLIIPFGVWGLIGFGAFCCAALRVLSLNFRYGRESLKLINTFLLSSFVAHLIYYVLFYGQFDSDIISFTGWIALSITLNAGVRRKQVGEREDHTEAVPVHSTLVA